MAFRIKLPLVCFLLFAPLLVYGASGTKDPELKQCKHQCRAQQQADERQIRRCLQECERYQQEKQRREREREEGGGSRDSEFNPDEYNPARRDPEKEYRRCQQDCRRQAEKTTQERCLSRCEEQRRRSERERRRGQGGEDNERHEGYESGEEEERQEEYKENPYVFQDEHFSTPYRTQHGSVRFLPSFTERSRLLRSIENYRVGILEAEPQTFIVPNHWDAEIIGFVARGRGTVSVVRRDRRETFNIRRGDIVRIPAGTTSYLINRDNNEKLVIAKLLQPVSTPGHFEPFFAAGVENRDSFYRVFSNEILEAAFNTRRDRLERLFGQRRQGVIIKASQEQIRALCSHEEGGIWPFGGEHKGAINIFQQRPSQSNQYGQLYEVAPDDSRQLEDLNVAVSYLNLTQGAMTGPLYSSKATKIALVVRGEGYLEMACPHLSSSQYGGAGRWGSQEGRQERHGSTSPREGRGGTSYQKVSARLRRGTVVIIPASHPFVTVASSNQNLEVVYFETNARDSWKYALAGRSNVINQWEREAKELTFGVPAREVEEVFGSQQEEFFFRGPRKQYEGRDVE